MKCIANTYYFSVGELVSRCNIALSTITDGKQRGSKQWQWIKNPDDRRELLIRYDTLADKYRATVRRVLCGGLEPHEMAIERTG